MPFKGDRGYALPLVLVGVAVLLLYVGETSSRLKREARVTKVRENGEVAFYGAEAGFNEAIARMQGLFQQNSAMPDATACPKMMSLAGTRTVAYTDTQGNVQVNYTLTISREGTGNYYIVSESLYGSDGVYQARRVLAGSIWVETDAIDPSIRYVTWNYLPIAGNSVKGCP